MPRHSLLSSRRMTQDNLLGSGACPLLSHRVTYSLHDGGSHVMNLAMADVMHPKTSCASIIWNWMSCNLGDWMTIMVPAYQRRKMHTLEVKLLWVQTTQKPALGSASRFQPTIQRQPWTASRRDIAPTQHTRDGAQFRAIGIGNPSSNDMRGSEPSSYERRRPRDYTNRHTENKPRQREPPEPDDYSRQPLMACDCVRRSAILANRALGTVRHLHGRCLTGHDSVNGLRRPEISSSKAV